MCMCMYVFMCVYVCVYNDGECRGVCLCVVYVGLGGCCDHVHIYYTHTHIFTHINTYTQRTFHTQMQRLKCIYPPIQTYSSTVV